MQRNSAAVRSDHQMTNIQQPLAIQPPVWSNEIRMLGSVKSKMPVRLMRWIGNAWEGSLIYMPLMEPVGRPYTSWTATLKSDLSLHNLTFEDAIELALDKSLWKLLVASGATHWHDAWCMPNNDDDDDWHFSSQLLREDVRCCPATWSEWTS